MLETSQQATSVIDLQTPDVGYHLLAECTKCTDSLNPKVEIARKWLSYRILDQATVGPLHSIDTKRTQPCAAVGFQDSEPKLCARCESAATRAISLIF